MTSWISRSLVDSGKTFSSSKSITVAPTSCSSVADLGSTAESGGSTVTMYGRRLRGITAPSQHRLYCLRAHCAESVKCYVLLAPRQEQGEQMVRWFYRLVAERRHCGIPSKSLLYLTHYT